MGTMLGLDDFTANLDTSGLVSPDVLTQIQAEVEPEPAEDAAVRLARRLIEGGWLTTYQARKLLSGATRGFFLGGYRLLRPLGEGGMGKVYLAVNDRAERVAIKVLPPRKALEEENVLRRFRREMELSQRCAHPNLARTMSVGNEGDVHFMVMEYIPGKSLYEHVKSERAGPLRVPDAARLVPQAGRRPRGGPPLGLVHRDIKPSNIMITPEGDVKLLDLGLARALDDDAGLTRANTVLGTLDYASPEQLRDAAKADRRSDLYSLGCTLYFALAGNAPFEGGDMINKIFKQRMEDPPAAGNGGARRAGGVRRSGPQAHEQEARGAIPGLRRAPLRPDALDRPGPRARDPRRRGRRRTQLSAAAARASRGRPSAPGRRRPRQPRGPVTARPRGGRAVVGPAPPGADAPLAGNHPLQGPARIHRGSPRIHHGR